jgi:hypothetical protein
VYCKEVSNFLYLLQNLLSDQKAYLSSLANKPSVEDVIDITLGVVTARSLTHMSLISEDPTMQLLEELRIQLSKGLGTQSPEDLGTLAIKAPTT